MLSILLPKGRKKDAILRTLAHEIANASRQEVRHFVSDYCTGMSVNEMRGYARARAAAPIRNRASQRARDLAGHSPREMQAVLQMATDYVVDLVVGEGPRIDVTRDTLRRAA